MKRKEIKTFRVEDVLATQVIQRLRLYTGTLNTPSDRNYFWTPLGDVLRKVIARDSHGNDSIEILFFIIGMVYDRSFTSSTWSVGNVHPDILKFDSEKSFVKPSKNIHFIHQ